MRCVEEDVHSVLTHYHCGILQRLSVADAYAIAADVAGRHRQIAAYPVDLGRRNPETAARKTFMGMAFTYIYYIIRNVGFDDKDRVLVTSDVQSLALAYCVELCSVVLSYYLSKRIFLVAGLLYVLLAASIGLCLELDFILDRL